MVKNEFSTFFQLSQKNAKQLDEPKLKTIKLRAK